MQEHHSTSSSTNQPAHIQWRGEAQPSHFQISNFEIIFNDCKAEEPKSHACAQVLDKGFLKWLQG
jgi:hypothetical protein